MYSLRAYTQVFSLIPLIKAILNIREIVVLCRNLVFLTSEFVKSLPAINRLTLDRIGSLPTANLAHQCCNGIADRRFQFLQILAKALAPDFRIADLRAYHHTFMIRLPELTALQEIPSLVQIHAIPIGGQ